MANISPYSLGSLCLNAQGWGLVLICALATLDNISASLFVEYSRVKVPVKIPKKIPYLVYKKDTAENLAVNTKDAFTLIFCSIMYS